MHSAAGKTRSQFKNSCTASFRLLQKSPTPAEIPVLLLASGMWLLANLRPLTENHPKLHPAECMHESAGKFHNVEGFQTAPFPHHEYLAQAKPDVTAGRVSAALREPFDKMWNFLQNRYCLGYYVPSLQNGSGEFSIQKTRGLFCLVSAAAPCRPASGWSYHVNQTALQILSKQQGMTRQMYFTIPGYWVNLKAVQIILWTVREYPGELQNRQHHSSSIKPFFQASHLLFIHC